MVASPIPGTLIADRWRLVHPLAEGGMSVVWVGDHVTLEQPVAVKLLHLHDDLDHREERIERFQREGRIAAALAKKSRHILPVIDLGVSGEWAYQVSELVEQGTLDDAIFRAPLSVWDVATIVEQIARGLTVVHAAGIVHRDLKPSNVAMGKDQDGKPFVRIFDFGVAKELVGRRSRNATGRGVALGTACTMSPEQARGLRIDARSDVWALACVAWEAMSGRPVVSGDTPDDTASRMCAFDLVPLKPGSGLSAELGAVFRRAFAYDIGDRYQDARSFASAFREALPTRRDDSRSRRRRIAAVSDVPTTPEPRDVPEVRDVRDAREVRGARKKRDTSG
jgi:serine/threonine protein kinase